MSALRYPALAVLAFAVIAVAWTVAANIVIRKVSS